MDASECSAQEEPFESDTGEYRTRCTWGDKKSPSGWCGEPDPNSEGSEALYLDAGVRIGGKCGSNPLDRDDGGYE